MKIEWVKKTNERDGDWYYMDVTIPYTCTVRLMVFKEVYNGKIFWACSSTCMNGNETLSEYFDEKKIGYSDLEEAKEWCISIFNKKLIKYKSQITNIETIEN